MTESNDSWVNVPAPFGFQVHFMNNSPQTQARDRIPNQTMVGKVMSGYQGWFAAPGDGFDIGWRHFNDTPGQVSFDMWPDMTECDPDECYPTKFRYADGRAASLYSANNPKTVLRHFAWMKQYGHDGVFLQRFVNPAADPKSRPHLDNVLNSVRKGASEYGRVYGLMYDISGMKIGNENLLIDDFKRLVDTTNFIADDRYIRHNGKPVVVIWGIGFTDGRHPLLEEGMKMVDFLKNDPTYGGNVVMLGVTYRWRTTSTQLVPIGQMHDIINAADIVSPWAVGRPRNVDDVVRNYREIARPDIDWCLSHGKEYMPVVFPGFSWYNLRRGRAECNEIPRQGGRFLWSQYVEAVKAGAGMVYQAMFDEVDEGTAIYKVTNDPPDGEGKSQFVTYEGLPSDFYLKLVGQGARLVRGEIGPGDDELVKNARWQPFTPSLPVTGAPLFTSAPPGDE